MTDLKLLPDEALLLQSDRVEQVGRKGASGGELYLTSRNLIYVNKSVFGKVKGIDKYPVDLIKRVNSQEQIFMIKSPKNGLPQLQIHLYSGVLTFQFDNFHKKQIEKWIQTLSKLLLYGPAQAGGFENTSAISGAEVIGDMVKDTVDIFRRALGGEAPPTKEPQYVAGICRGCGAPVSGLAGQVIRCRYCNSEQLL